MTKQGESTASAKSIERGLRLAAAMLPLLITLGVQLALRSYFQPSIWFLVYPAVFLSSWIGGVRAAIIASAIAAAFILWFFLPPEHSFAKPLSQYVSTSVFFATGVFFGVFHDRLRAANRRTTSALVAAQRANDDLRKAIRERRIFAALIENSSDFIGIADPAAKSIYVNPAGRRMVGLAVDQPIENMSILEYYPADQHGFAADVIVKTMMEKGHWQGETSFYHWQTQASIPVSDTHFMIRDPESDELLGMGTITRDISDVKQARDEAERARRELQRASEALASLFQQAPDGILVVSPEGRYTEINDAGCRMLGYAREEIIGRGVIDLLLSGEGIAQLEREKQQSSSGGGGLISEWALRRKDGTCLTVDVSAKILSDGRWQIFIRDNSARKQFEATLRASRDDLNRAQSVAKVGSWRLDIRRNEFRWSDETYRIFGVSPGTPMTYKAFLACVHPDDRAYVDREWAAALRGQPYDLEHRIVADGAIKWVREKADLEFDDTETLVGGIGITHDITARKRAEEELRLAEAKASGIVSIAADAIISIDEKQRIMLFNEGAEQIFGYTKAEAIGASLDQLIPERFRGTHRSSIERFAAGGASARRMGERGEEIFGLRRTGEEFPADAAISKLDIAGTRILTVALRDVTEQKRFENEQKLLAEVGSVLASTLELQSILTSIGQLTTRTLADACVVCTVDERGEAHRLDAMIRDPARGWIRDALVQRSFDRARAREIWSELEANRSVLMARVSPEMVAASAQSDEHLRILRALDPRSVIAAPLFAHGRLVGAMGLISSAPGRVYTPADVRFVEQVAQRAALAIDNAQLYAEARRAIQTRDEVLGIVAHDLRNPLGAILMQVALLRKLGGEQDRRLGRTADSIERSVMRMSRLIEDLLDVTRMEEGHLSVEPVRASVHQAMSDAIQAQEALAAASSLELRIEAARDLPEVWADRDRLLQIFENLIGNAVKFTGAGGIITVGAAPRASDVLFSVADTGAGIAAEDVPHVFDRFWQVQRGRRRGAGLGLPIAKGLVEAHGGRIWVESASGRGTTFFFTIPMSPRPAQ